MASTKTYESTLSWRERATNRIKPIGRPPAQDEPLLDWVGHTLYHAEAVARSGEGAKSSAIMGAARAALAEATPLELIEAVIVDANRGRPPRSAMVEDGGEGRYASLTITALEEAEGWERRRAEAARAR